MTKVQFSLLCLLGFIMTVTCQDSSTTVATSGSAAASSSSGGVSFDSQDFGNEETGGRAEASISIETTPRSPPPESPSPDPQPQSPSPPTDSPSPSPSAPPVQFPVDFSTTEASLRTAIFQEDVTRAAEALGSNRVVSLGAGLTFPSELAPLVEPTERRNRDPDVVAFKALAQSALDTGDASKLATAVILSFQPDCQCRLRSAEEIDDLRLAFEEDFRDQRALREIVEADANVELTRRRSRRLQQAGKSPVNSFVCANCWPRQQCNKVFWC